MNRNKLNHGMTFIEVLLASALTLSTLGAVYTTFFSGEMAFNASDAALTGEQTARNAVDVISQDLASSQIYSYCHAVGAGKLRYYVKYRRMQTQPVLAPSAILDANAKVVWENSDQMHMYAWCPAEARLSDPCQRIQGLPALPANTPALTGPLFLLISQTANSQINVANGWLIDRTVANDVTDFTVNVAGRDASTGNLLAGNAYLPPSDSFCSAWAPGTAAGTGEGCVNARAHTVPASAFNTNGLADHLPVWVDVSISVSVRMSNGVRVPATIKRRIYLRNPQN